MIHISIPGDRQDVHTALKSPFVKDRLQHPYYPKLEQSVYFDEEKGVLTSSVQKPSVAKQVEAYQKSVVENDAKHFSLVSRDKKRILLTGGSGFVGKKLQTFLRYFGHDVFVLTRGQAKDHSHIPIDYSGKKVALEQLENMDALIHLAGEGIANKRWSQRQKELLISSRINTTKFLVEQLEKLIAPPKVFMCASAIGIYEEREENLTENAPHGDNFLAKLCEDWEAAAKSYSKGRVVHLRFGIVLSPDGGALQKMLPPFSLGLGGVIGNGKQWMSPIAMDDLLYGIHFLLQKDSSSGPYNLVSPSPVTNYTFTKVLGKVLKRPTLFPLPAFVVRLVFGQMGVETILSNQRVKPERLLEEGFHFSYPDIKDSMQHLLGR